VPTMILNSQIEKKEQNREYVLYHEQENFMHQLNNILYERNIDSLIVEGGSKLLQSFIDERNWDEARVITNQKMIQQDGLPAPVLSDEKLYQSENLGSDLISYFKK
jgi:diaminohydroxyphosphoribosylaminopyrimidine deaminase/5-amino-6-(5-phosphoribosylamino)uracil reductase